VAELLGRHRYQLDAKGRIPLPAKMRDAFTEGLILTVGQDGPLYAFPRDQWDRYREDVATSPFASAEQRAFARMFLSEAEEGRLDAQGRLLIPLETRRQVRLQREAVVVGVSNRLEIWPAEEWDRYHASKIGAYLDGSLNPQGER
jgi:MraZ protein